MQLLKQKRTARHNPRRAYFEALETRTYLTGTTWTPLANAAPINIGTMSLMPDGSVIATSGNTDGEATWARLVPDIHGSYIHGTWTQLASAHDSRLYDATQVLPDGTLFVAGGEYGTTSGGTTDRLKTAETYNPLTNTWTQRPDAPYKLSDSDSKLLMDGNILVLAVYGGGKTPVYLTASNTWTTTTTSPTLANSTSVDEQSAVTLPDGSVMIVQDQVINQVMVQTSQRFLPSNYPGSPSTYGTWIADAAPPIPMSHGDEYGPAVMLNDGRCLFFSESGTVVLYTPSGTTAPGTWSTGPSLPANFETGDAPAAILPDGTVLVVAGPFSGPTSFFVYTPSPGAGGSISPALTGGGIPTTSGPPFVSRLLDLPDGTMLYAQSNTQAYVYNPMTSPSGLAPVPNITNVVVNSNGTLKLTGTGFNGYTSGAVYGDDAQMDSNYPIVRFTNGLSVYYATTSGWDLPGRIRTGSTVEHVTVTLPVGIPAGTYSMTLTGSGITSAPVNQVISTILPNTAPTVATAASATPSPVTAKTTTLSVLGADDKPANKLIYTWQTLTAPAGALPSFSINGTNAAKSTVATFSHAGTYTFKAFITDQGGLSVSSMVTVTVNQTETSISINPPSAALNPGHSQQFTGSLFDQFGLPMAGAVTYSVTGGGTINPTTGIYIAPTIGANALVKATGSVKFTTASVTVVSPPWSQIDVGTPIPLALGSGYDIGGTFTIGGAGQISNGAAGDQLHYVYRPVIADGSITARVTSQANDATGADSGVMIRDNIGNLTDSKAPMAVMYLSKGGVATFAYRPSEGMNVVIGGTINVGAPQFVQLVRSGSTISGYVSASGTAGSWSLVGSASLTLSTTLNFGMEQLNTSTTAATATFKNVLATQAINQLVFTQQPTTVQAGQTINPAVQVTLEDINGNIITGNSAAVTISLIRGLFSYGTLGGTPVVTVNPATGIATFSDLTVSSEGSYSLSAAGSNFIGGLSQKFTVTANGPMPSFSQPSTTAARAPTALTNALAPLAFDNTPVTLSLDDTDFLGKHPHHPKLHKHP